MSTQARQARKHVSTQARKHDKHVSMQARKHAKHASTQVRQARDIANSRKYFLYEHFIVAVKWLEIGDKTFIDLIV